MAGSEREAIQRTALDIIRWSYDKGWDAKEGGLYYFLDAARTCCAARLYQSLTGTWWAQSGRSPAQLEWSMKLWWPHCEAMVALLWAYKLTKDEQYLGRFTQASSRACAHACQVGSSTLFR
jgi:N-acylglucosamine 2-epimerase